MSAAVEKPTMHKVYWRLLPIGILTYLLCYLDRINVGFAALTMNKDLGLDASVYGLAAGAFYWGYFLFEVPSNMILEKVGARIWIARIMISWGLLSGATAFCTGPWSFMTMRFLLGLAEAGLVSRHDAVFHLLVPRLASRPHRRWIHRGVAARGRGGLADIDGFASAKRRVGPCRLEVDVHCRGNTHGAGGHFLSHLRHRPARSGTLAQ